MAIADPNELEATNLLAHDFTARKFPLVGPVISVAANHLKRLILKCIAVEREFELFPDCRETWGDGRGLGGLGRLRFLKRKRLVQARPPFARIVDKVLDLFPRIKDIPRQLLGDNHGQLKKLADSVKGILKHEYPS